jgi:hypothetical protein
MSFIVPADEGICYLYSLTLLVFITIALFFNYLFNFSSVFPHCQSSFHSFILFRPVSDLLIYSPYFMKKDKLVISVHI